MTRTERQKLEIDGIHFDNSDIKDIFEDAHDIAIDHADLAYDWEYQPFQDYMQIDYNLNHQQNVENFRDTFMADFNINSIEEWDQAIDGMFIRWLERVDTWPQVHTLKKAHDRLIREIGAQVTFSDLPEGLRMSWVNDFFEGLVGMLKSGNPAEQIDEYIGYMFMEFMKEFKRYSFDMYVYEEKKFGPQ